MAKQPPAFSPLVLDELFAAGEERFLDHLIKFHEPKKLASIADRWKRDSRPWARRTLFQYLERLPASPGHEPLVKRLFKHAEETRDDELMAHFACAFDRLVRRKRAERWTWDPSLRQARIGEHLASPHDTLPNLRQAPAPGTEPLPSRRLYRYKTRHYLRRRAWRYFRRMGHQRAGEYPGAVARMLRLYADADLASGEAFLDSRSLMHACFRGTDLLEFTPRHVNLRPDRSLAELTAAPAHEEMWKSADSAGVLMELCAVASSKPVRAWGVHVFRGFHFEKPPALTPGQLLPLLDSADELVQQLGADLLERAVGLDKLGVDDWLRLLQTKNLAALETITRVMRRHVAPERISLAQAVELASAAPVPVARLGLELIKGKAVATAEDRDAVARLADARSAGVAPDITAWALGILGAPDVYDADRVVRFFDALLLPTRQAAWAWLTRSTDKPRAADDPALWSRLIETPYDDVRLHLVDELKRRASLPGVSSDRLGPALWAPVLLGIFRGGRLKLTALRQVADAIARDPQNAEPLLPVLAVAVRSVRLPEARHGLAAVVRAVDARPDLAGAVGKHFPELELGEPACR